MKFIILIILCSLIALSGCRRIGRSEFEIFTDIRDGQEYKVIRAGGLMWFAENLKYEYDNCWCYDDNKYNCAKYGRLYSWWSAPRHVPAGWRLPTENDWDRLSDFFGGKDSMIIKFLYNQDERFRIPLSGMRFGDGTYTGLDSIAGFWTADQDNKNYAYIRYVKKETSEFSRQSVYKWDGFCVRCVKNNE